jgi:Tol biopolymer transport system component
VPMATILSAFAAVLAVLSAGPAAAQSPYGSQIYSVRLDGHGLVNLSRQNGLDALPSAAPQGGRIAFVRFRPSGLGHRSSLPIGELWTMRSDGSEQRRLAGGVVVGDAFVRPPTWSPNGREIAFWGESDGGRSGVWVVDLEGRLRRLANAESSPAWSPDGRLIAFDEFDPSTCGPIDRNCATALLEVVAPDGTGLRTLATDAIRPSWSPTGARLAFAGGAAGTDAYSLDVVSPLGGSPRTVVRRRNAWSIAWSPRGRHIAFVDQMTGSAFVATLRGGPLRRLGGGGRGPLPSLAWSPRGNRIAFALRADGAHVTTIWAARLDGSRRRRIETVRGVVSDLAWSVDGSRLIYTRERR